MGKLPGPVAEMKEEVDVIQSRYEDNKSKQAEDRVDNNLSNDPAVSAITPPATTPDPLPVASADPDLRIMTPEDRLAQERGVPQSNTPEPKAVNSISTVDASEYEKLERRYQTLKFKYDNEVGPLMREKAAMAKRVDAMLERIGVLEEQAKKVDHRPIPERVLSEEEREMFADGAADGMVKISAAAAKEEFDRSINPAVEPLREELREARLEIAYEKFIRRLLALVPDYQEIDKSQEFVTWLNGYTPDHQHTWREYLHESERNGDAQRCADVFNTYKNEVLDKKTKEDNPLLHAGGEPLSAADPNPASNPYPSPGGSSNSDMIPYSEIQAFDLEVQKKKSRWRDHPEDKKKMEELYDQAMRDGRVDWNR